jgi:ATP-dependent RNA helicase DDX49/DBP8
MSKQSIELGKQPHVIIATPGRLADHINSGTNIKLNKSRLSFVFLSLSRLLYVCVSNASAIHSISS